MMISLHASEGFIITNGTEYGTTVRVAEGEDISKFYEITEEEYKNILAEREAEHAEII